MLNALFVFSQKGELVVSKLIRDTIKRSVAEIFRIQVINNLDVRSPVLTLGSTTFHHIRSSSNLWIVAVTRSNADSAAIWEFLYKFNALLEAYGLNSEESLKEEFMTCYELLDVVLENGVPVDTELSSVASKMSRRPVVSLENNPLTDDLLMSAAANVDLGFRMPKFLNKGSRSSSSVSSPANGDEHGDPCAYPWRPSGIKYKKNEIFLDVNERINILVSKDGSILKSYVDGSVDLTTHLSGTPLCQFGLNDSLSLDGGTLSRDLDFISEYEVKNKKAIPKAAAGSVQLEDCKFHQCVQLNRFNTDRIIRFVPPDGSFELMRYHVRDNLNLPFKITPIFSVRSNNGAVEYRVALKSLFPSKLTAKDVVLRIPVPPGTVDCKINTSNGRCRFVPEENAVLWKFAKYQGLTENTLSALTVPMDNQSSLNLQQWSRPPMSLTFEILMFSNSGLVVRFFKVSERDHNYHTVKWVKYISRSGAYEVRY